MEKLQFKVLYRQFLFRMIDLELLSSSAQGDINRLLGQFAALFLFLSASLGLIILFMGEPGGTFLARLLVAWSMEHFLIATTILIVGLFAVISWDSMFPDRRDLLVLAPLPVRARTLFLAKVASVGAALAISVGVFNAFIGFAAPLVYGATPAIQSLGTPVEPGNPILGTLRLFGVYWFTMLAAGVFTFGLVISVQGVAQLLPRQKFLRVSAILQIVAFIFFIGVFFMQFPFASLDDLATPQGRKLLPWLPSYWFFGMMQQLNGSKLFVSGPELVTVFARRAWIGLGASVVGAAASYLICYFRTLRKIAEQPDILPGRRHLRWLPDFGGAISTAIAHFSIRTLLRSRRHRVTMAFYLGVAFAIVLFLSKAPLLQEPQIEDPWRQPTQSLLAASILVIGSAVIGIRVAISIPLDLRANWIFRVAPIQVGKETLAGARWSIAALSAIPLCSIATAVFLWLWPWKQAMEHVAILALLGIGLCEACLLNFRKLPFTCSYLPGKTYFHMGVLAYVGTAWVVGDAVRWEESALKSDPGMLVVIFGYLIGAVLLLRRWNSWRSGSTRETLEFETIQPPEILPLGLHRDGASLV